MYSFRNIIDEKVWDAFIDRADPNTFLSSWAWSDVEEDLGRGVHRIGIFDGERQIGAFLAVAHRARRGRILICPHGPVLEAGVSLNTDILRSVREKLRRIGDEERCVCARMCPLIFDSAENRSLFASCGFRRAPLHAYSELSWVLDITSTEDVLLKNMRKNTRYGIRKAEKDGIEVSSSENPDDLPLFWDLYLETAQRHHFVVYPKELIESEFKRFAARSRARWYFARFRGEVVSAALITYSATTAFYHHGASLHAASSITSSEALQWRIIQDAKARGLKRYNFWGVVPDDENAHPWAGLSRFKKGFGGSAEAYLHAQDVPLSTWYWMLWAIELLRKWKRHL